MSIDDKTFAAIERTICELPDRSSPDDWPEAMLVTGPELRRILDKYLPNNFAVEPQPFSSPNRQRADVPCPLFAHFYRVDPASEDFLKPILYCPVCGWTYKEIAEDGDLCIRERCENPRTAGTAYCEQHQLARERQ